MPPEPLRYLCAAHWSINPWPWPEHPYSKTSDNGPSKNWTTSVQRTAHLPRLTHTTNIFRTTEKQTPLNSKQWTLISPRRTLANTKLPPKMNSEVTPTLCGCLLTAFVAPPSLNSMTKYYISTVANRASLSHQCKATERSENAISSHSKAWPITDYHAYRKYTECL